MNHGVWASLHPPQGIPIGMATGARQVMDFVEKSARAHKKRQIKELYRFNSFTGKMT